MPLIGGCRWGRMEHRPTGHPLESKEQVQGYALLGAQALAACTLYKAGRNAYHTYSHLS